MAATRRRGGGRIGLVAAGIGALATNAVRGDSTIDFRTLYYGEGDNRTEVVNPELLFTQDFGEKGQLGLLLAYDSISGASPTGEFPTVDATTTASAAGNSSIPMVDYQDTRRAGSLSYSKRFGAHLPSVDLSYSREGDYLSKGVSLVDSWDLFGKRSTFHAGVGILRDHVYPAHTDFDYPKKSLSLSAGWTQVMGPRDLMDFSLGLTKLDGYLTDPYKVVTVGATVLPEVRPDTRSRKTAMIKYGHYYLSRTAVKIAYRYYWDDWDLKAHTLDLGWDKRVGPKLILSPRLRFYQQGAASFFAYEFAAPQPAMSADYRLSAFWSWLVGLGIRVDLTDNVAFILDASYNDQTGTDRVTPRSLVPVPVRIPAGTIGLAEDRGRRRRRRQRFPGRSADHHRHGGRFLQVLRNPLYERTLYTKRFRVMGGPGVLRFLDDRGREVADAVAGRAIAEAERIERKYSRYLPGSVISRINRDAGRTPVAVDSETMHLVGHALRLSEETGGAFDPTVGVLRRIWDFREGRTPAPAEVERLLPLVDRGQVSLRDGTIFLRRGGMELDLGGVGKEYAVDRVAACLLEDGVRCAVVNLSGDLRTLGSRGDGRPWNLGVIDPRDKGKCRFAVRLLGGGGVASSGDYERFFVKDGIRYHHILDARTGWPARGVASSTVIAPDAFQAGLAATASFLLGPRKGLEYLEERPGIEGVLITDQGELLATQGMEGISDLPGVVVRPLPKSLETALLEWGLSATSHPRSAT